jgi:hypothetical protein
MCVPVGRGWPLCRRLRPKLLLLLLLLLHAPRLRSPCQPLRLLGRRRRHRPRTQRHGGGTIWRRRLTLSLTGPCRRRRPWPRPSRHSHRRRHRHSNGACVRGRASGATGRLLRPGGLAHASAARPRRKTFSRKSTAPAANRSWHQRPAKRPSRHHPRWPLRSPLVRPAPSRRVWVNVLTPAPPHATAVPEDEGGGADAGHLRSLSSSTSLSSAGAGSDPPHSPNQTLRPKLAEPAPARVPSSACVMVHHGSLQGSRLTLALGTNGAAV